MGVLDNINQGEFADLMRRIRALENRTTLNNSAIGRAGMEVYDQGVLNISDGSLVVNGTATISGVLNADGTVTLSGVIGISGPLTVTGATALNGPTTVGGNTTVTGNLTTNGPLDVNGATTLDGNTTATGTVTVNGPMNINGAAKTTGTLSVEGSTTLNNTLTVAAGKKITLGGLTLENTGASGGQVNFPGGSITASTALGMLINHSSVEIAGTTVKISTLPTTTQPANLYADTSGRLYRSTV